MHFPEAQERNPNYYHYFLWKNHVRLTRFLLTRRLQERNPRVNRELTVTSFMTETENYTLKTACVCTGLDV